MLFITGINPASGGSGTLVTISGSGFGAVQGTGSVLLGSMAGQVVSWSDAQVVAMVSTGSLTGVVRIQQNGVWSNGVGFTVPGGSATLVPDMLNLMVGDTHTIQAVNPAGQPVTGLTWASSDPTVVGLSTDNPPILTALAAGHVTITAGGATTDVVVSAAASGGLPTGTILWSNPGDGSGVNKIVPAVPSPSGVADVFAFQQDGTVQAITGDGVTAWSADVSQSVLQYADFQGGLVLAESPAHDGNYRVVKLDGMTGQRYPAYTFQQAAGAWMISPIMAVHPDGTVFTVKASGAPYVDTVVGIDPTTGSQKFSIQVSPAYAEEWGIMIAGDGYAYVPYSEYDGAYVHFKVMRVSSSGAYRSIPIQDWRASCDDTCGVWPTMITNADTGIVISWLSQGGWLSAPQLKQLAIVTGASASVVKGPEIAGQVGAIEPVLQAQDGSFVGTTWTTYQGEAMVVFDAAGNVRWSVPNEQPQIATADGGVIGKSGITYDQDGNATGQFTGLPILSWTGNAYQIGSVHQLLLDPIYIAASFWAFLGANNSGNSAAVGRTPTTLVISKKLGVLQDCYSSVGVTGVSYAERDITYNVIDQYKSRMSGGMRIQEHLLPAPGTPCPSGTNLQGGLCIGAWINKLDEFPDTLSANPLTGHSEYTQMFWVATPPNTPGYAAFYGQIKIDAYQPSPSPSTALIETQYVINVNGNAGMNPNGTPRRRCN